MGGVRKSEKGSRVSCRLSQDQRGGPRVRGGWGQEEWEREGKQSQDERGGVIG